MGYRSGYQNTTGSFNTAIGYNAYFVSDTLSNTICIGTNAGGMSNVNNRTEIGNSSMSWIGGQGTWSTYSDARIKTNIQEDVIGLDFIKELRPVTYNLDVNAQNSLVGKDSPEWKGKYDIENVKMTGFIAQEVAAAAEKSGYNFSGVSKANDRVGLYSVSYAQFVVPLVKATQEQQEIIEGQNEKIEKLEKENEELKELILQLIQRVETLEND